MGYTHFLQNAPWFLQAHAVKRFGIVSVAEIGWYNEIPGFSTFCVGFKICSLVPLLGTKVAWSGNICGWWNAPCCEMMFADNLFPLSWIPIRYIDLIPSSDRVILLQIEWHISNIYVRMSAPDVLSAVLAQRLLLLLISVVPVLAF